LLQLVQAFWPLPLDNHRHLGSSTYSVAAWPFGAAQPLNIQRQHKAGP